MVAKMMLEEQQGRINLSTLETSATARKRGEDPTSQAFEKEGEIHKHVQPEKEREGKRIKRE